MSKIISFFAYIIAVLCIVVAVATFVGNGFFAAKIADLTGIRVSPVFSGGEVKKILKLKGYEVKIHEPVFQGLFSPRKNGFVQVDFVGEEIPGNISSDIDYDNDGITDFKISVDTKSGKGTIESFDKRVVSLIGIYPIKNGFAARINLRSGKLRQK
jgi:hypothetical protein